MQIARPISFVSHLLAYSRGKSSSCIQTTAGFAPQLLAHTNTVLKPTFSLQAEICIRDYFLYQPVTTTLKKAVFTKIGLEESHPVGIANATLKHINLHQIFQAPSTWQAAKLLRSFIIDKEKSPPAFFFPDQNIIKPQITVKNAVDMHLSYGFAKRSYKPALFP